MQIEIGKYRTRAILSDVPSRQEMRKIERAGVDEIICNGSLGWRGSAYSFLPDIPNLRSLVVLDRRRIDLSPLEKLPHIEQLNLQVGTFQRFDFSGLERLRHYYIEWIPGAETVLGLQQVEHASILGLPEKYLSRVGDYKSLSTLKLFSTRIRQIADLGKPAGLKYLRLASCRTLKSLAGIDQLANLETLLIQGCPIRAIKELSGHSHLASIALDTCGEIESLEPLRTVEPLESLLLIGTTKIVDGRLDHIQQLPKLREFGAKQFKHYTPSAAEVEAIISQRAGRGQI